MRRHSENLSPLQWLALIGSCLIATLIVVATSRGDTVIYQRDDGTRQFFSPKTGQVSNRPAAGIRVIRPDGSVGEWVASGPDRPDVATTKPTTVPVVIPPVVPPVIPPVITVIGGPVPLTPGPGDIVIRKGDSPAKIHAALNSTGRAFLERGGSWPGRFVLNRSGTPTRPAGLFATGNPDLPPPIILGTTGADGKGDAVSVQGNIHDVAFIGIEIAPVNPKAKSRGQGLYVGGAVTNVLVTIHVHDFNTNLVLEGRHRGSVVIDGTSSHHAHYGSDKLFAGQGTYTDYIIDGPVIRNSVFYHNGPQSDALDDITWNQYRHGDYNQGTSAGVVFIDCISARNAADGVMLRNGGRIERSVFYDNGTNLMLPGDGKASGKSIPVPIIDCDIVGAHTYYDGGGHWIAGTAIDTASKISPQNVRIVAIPGQGTPRPLPRDTRSEIRRLKDFGKTYPGGALSLSFTTKQHPEWSSGAGIVNGKNVRVTSDWPGQVFAGAAGPQVYKDSGKVVGMMPPVPGVRTAWLDAYCREAAEQWRITTDRTAAGARARLSYELAAVGWK